jgi:hypothetical protein
MVQWRRVRPAIAATGWLLMRPAFFLRPEAGTQLSAGWDPSAARGSASVSRPAFRRKIEPSADPCERQESGRLTARIPRSRLQACPIWRRLHEDWSARLGCLQRMPCASHESSTNSRAPCPGRLPSRRRTDVQSRASRRVTRDASLRRRCWRRSVDGSWLIRSSRAGSLTTTLSTFHHRRQSGFAVVSGQIESS